MRLINVLTKSDEETSNIKKTTPAENKTLKSFKNSDLITKLKKSLNSSCKYIERI